MDAAWANRTSPIGPLPDPRWAGFFQAMNDVGASFPRTGRVESGGTAGDALGELAASMPYAEPPVVQGAAPSPPPAPPAPKAPSLPPPTAGARPAQARPPGPRAQPPSSSA